MEYKKVAIGSDSLHMIKTDRFKTITVRVMIKEKVEKENITKRNFLASMLTDSTKKYPTKRSLTLEAENLYNVDLSTISNRTGNYSNINLLLSTLTEKYTEKGMFEKSIKLLSEVLFHPNIKDGAFDLTSFQYIKENCYKAIRALKEKNDQFSMVRMLELMGEEAFSYRDYGYLEDVEKITPENLVTYYEQLMNHASFDFYIIGDIDFKEVETLIKKYFKIRTFKHNKISPSLLAFPKNKRKVEVIEYENISQSKLNIGCIVEEVEGFELNYVWNIYTILLGASPDSKFFQNIREKHSLAYYVTASMRKLDHIMILRAGIDHINFSKTLSLMEHEMKEIEKGHFTEEDIEKAKQLYITATDEIFDSPNAILESYVASDFIGCDPLEIRRERIKDVTKKDIIKFSKKVSINTIYLLTGEEHNNEKN